MFGIPNPYAIAGGVALALAALGGAYIAGDSAGANRVISRDAKAFKRDNDAMQRAIARMNVVQDKLAHREGERRDQVKEIYREVPKIVDRPVYHTTCIDDDGVRLLERAAAAANGDGRPQPPAGTGAPPGGDVHN